LVAKKIEIVVGVAASVIADGALGSKCIFRSYLNNIRLAALDRFASGSYGNRAYKIELRLIELEDIDRRKFDWKPESCSEFSGTLSEAER
jgi:hypothetical protein